jgi:hypothetical protein
VALLTAAELQTSREAQEAGLGNVSDADATTAITEATAELYSHLGFKVETTQTTLTFRGVDKRNVFLAQRARTVSSITEDGNTTTPGDYHLSNSGWILVRESGRWTAEAIIVTGTFGFASTDDEYVMAKKAVKILAVRYLSSTSSANGLPAGAAGALLTGFSSEQASFQFFTPAAEMTGHPDVDRLIGLIQQSSGWPFLSKKVLISVPLVGRTGDERPYYGDL